jgi:DNA-binding beta-propeller fold protein YncE
MNSVCYHVLPILPFVLLLGSVQAAEPSASNDAHSRQGSTTASDLAPVAVVSAGQDQLAVLGSAARRLLVIDRASGQLLHEIPLPAEASGIVIRDRTAYVTTNEPAGRLLQIDLDSRRIERSWRVGHMPTAPRVSPDGGTVFLANRSRTGFVLSNCRRGCNRGSR